MYGGAIYVADNTTSVLCATSEVESITAVLLSECFTQIAAAGEYPAIGILTSFVRNIAHSSGAKLYGGLLDKMHGEV